MSPRAPRLSPDGEGLRRALQQDMRDAIRVFASAEIETLRQDVQKLLSGRRHDGASGASFLAAEKRQEPPAALPLGGNVDVAEVVAGVSKCVPGGPAAAPPSRDAELALAEAMETHHEVFGLRLTVSRLAALLQRAGGGGGSGSGGIRGAPPKDARLARDVEVALRVALAGDAAGAGGVAERPAEVPSSTEEDLGRRSNCTDDSAFMEVDEHACPGRQTSNGVESTETQADHVNATVSSLSLAPSVTGTDSTATMVDQDGRAYKWEWERSGGKGWAPYTKSRSRHIEQAWRNGLSRVRLRSGQSGQTPMEIFLVDMVQLDPVSMNQRRVRRIGHVPWWRTLQRHFRALGRQIRTGEVRWESLEQYRMRQESVIGPTIDNLKARMLRINSNELEEQKSQRRLQLGRWRRRCIKVATSDTFSVVSIFVTVLQAFWVGVDVDRNFGLTLYQKRPLDQFLDHFFCVFFSLELFIRLMTYTPYKECWKSAWFCFDAFLVLSSIVEVLVLAPMSWIAIGDDSVDSWEGLSVFRVVRLAKLVRIFRVFGASSDAVPFFKGLLSGMRSAAFIWGLLLALLFMFSVVLRLNAHEDIVDTEFSSVPVTMLKLVTSGVMLDNVAFTIDGILEINDWFTFVCFAAFVFLAHFNLLNMLIGVFCSVAGEVSTSEKDSAQVEYLRGNLACIADCYIQDHGKIGKREFQLIMKNVDVHRTLAQCGTDMDELASLETWLFFKKDEIDFEALFKAIVHLRKGKTATVKDIMNAQNVLSRQLDGVRKKFGIDDENPARSTDPASSEWL